MKKLILEIFRDDASSLFRFSCGNELLTVSFGEYESFLRFLIVVGLVNRTVSPSRLKSLIASLHGADFANSSASVASYCQEIEKHNEHILGQYLVSHKKKHNNKRPIEGP